MTTILCHVQDDDTFETRVENALSIARATSGHITLLSVTPAEAYVAFDSLGGVFVMADVMAALEEQQQRVRQRVEDRLRGEDVSWTYRHASGSTAGEIVAHAALADLIVTSREPGELRETPSMSLFGDILAHSRTPLMIAGKSVCDPRAPAAIAWNGSFEAAHAVRASLGLLRLAASVHVLRVAEADRQESFPATGLLEYLSRHGIHAELTIVPMDRQFICADLITEAHRRGAGFLVTGSYGHSRIGEYIFGGVTRDLLAGSPLPLVTVH